MFCGYLRDCRFILYGYAAANCQVIVPFSDKFERVPPLRSVHTLTKLYSRFGFPQFTFAYMRLTLYYVANFVENWELLFMVKRDVLQS